MVVRDEPLARVQRAIDALSVQRNVEPFVVVIAAPTADVERLRAIEPRGAVRSLVPVENPGGARSAGLNAAVRAAGAEIVVRVDARSVVSADHVERCVTRLHADPAVGMVGGVQRPEAFSASVRDRGVARALRNPWMLGNASYRRPGASGATDTVYLGAFRSRELLDLGGYDERLAANEDYDLSTRYRAGGRVVWLEDGLIVGYEPRRTFLDLWRQYRSFGAAKVRFWRATGRRPNARQTVALAAGGAAGVAVVAAARRPRALLALGVTGTVVLAIVDHLADPHERDPRVRVRACYASVAVVGGWWSGVASAFLARTCTGRGEVQE
jgi:GT2 family glycosyltransferase